MIPLQVPDLDVVIGLECTNFFHVVIFWFLRPPFLLALGESPNRMAKLVGPLTNAMVPVTMSSESICLVVIYMYHHTSIHPRLRHSA